jgi:hypothetical protein
MLVLITGLPAAGKTTLGQMLLDDLQRRGIETTHLDGDDLRQGPLAMSASTVHPGASTCGGRAGVASRQFAAVRSSS